MDFKAKIQKTHAKQSNLSNLSKQINLNKIKFEMHSLNHKEIMQQKLIKSNGK